MTRFKFGKHKKKVDETDISMNSNEQKLDEQHDNTSPIMKTVAAQTPLQTPKLQQAAQQKHVETSRIAISASTPWKRYKLFNSPFPRYRHAAAGISSEKNEIFLMGGLKEGSVFGDTWKIIPEETSSGEISSYVAENIEVVNRNNPPARVGHSAVLCGNAFILYGGDTVDTDSNGFPDNNFYLFNINNNKYTVPSHILNKPNGRYGHTIGAISLNSTSSRLYLFAGQLENDVFNDMYYFELNSFKSPKARWEIVEPLNNFKPPPLTNHSMSIHKHKIYIFGGVYNNEKVSNDLWSFDALSNKWTQIPTTGNIPLPVNEHSSCIVNDKLYIYGGNDFSGVIYSSLHVLDLHSLVWSKLTDDGKTNGPGPRCGHSMTYLPKNNKLIIMGGDKNDYIVDDPNNFDTYEEYNGEEIGTMIYELDLDITEHFLTNIPSHNAKKSSKKLAALATSTTKRNAQPLSQDDVKQGFERHTRSFSAGPEDFRTPNTSPERVTKIVYEPLDQQSRQTQDKFVEVEVPSSAISDHNVSTDNEVVPETTELLKNAERQYPGGQHTSLGSETYHNGHSSLLDTYGYADSSENLKKEKSNTPVVDKDVISNHEREINTRDTTAPSSSASNDQHSDDSKVKKLVSELTTELTQLKASTKFQMQKATEKINNLEQENLLLKQYNDKDLKDLKNQLEEKDLLVTELKNSIDPKSLEIQDNEENSKETFGTSSITELSKYKLERLELNNKLIYLEQENKLLTEKFAKFEPFMNNQIGELSNFQKIIKVQEEKIEKLSHEVKYQQELCKERNEWKTKFENLQLEFNNYKTIHTDDEISDDEMSESHLEESNGTDPVNKSIISTSTTGKKSKKDISSHLENLVNLWSTKNHEVTSKDVSNNEIGTNIENDAIVAKLQKQVDDLLRIGKQNELDASQEVGNLKNELNSKVESLKQFEENYRDALQSVNNTSKALKLNQDELNSQKILIEKLVKENNELKLFKKASRRISSRNPTPIIDEEPEAKASGPFDEDDDEAMTNAHFNMKIKDLEADLYILKQERDQLKDTVTSLQKQLYLAQNHQ